MRVAISGFGRIGREVTRILTTEKPEGIELAAINIVNDLESEMRLFKYDSIYGIYDKEVEIIDESTISINGQEIKVVSDMDPENLAWDELDIDLAIDSTGAFKDREGLSKHLKAGAKKVMITAPGKGVDHSFVMGVNEEEYNPENHNIISNASCTTNCLAPVCKVILDEFGIEKAMMTTIHAYTASQNVHDGYKKDPRRARAAGLSLIPTTTGAAKAIADVIPELEGKIDGYAVRVPTPTVSMVDVVFETEKETNVQEVNAAFKEASESDKMKGILGYTEEPLVSIDYQGDSRSSIVDGPLTMVDGNMVKVVSWYDNEWGYSSRVVDLAKLIADQI